MTQFVQSENNMADSISNFLVGNYSSLIDYLYHSHLAIISSFISVYFRGLFQVLLL